MEEDPKVSKKSTYDPSLYTNEAKKERFQRVATRRVNKALEALRLIGNVGNRSLYSYTDAEIEKMFGALENKILEIKGKFRTEKKGGNFKF